jgi:hypothetical protein
MRDPLSPPDGRRHPYAVWVAIICVLSGASIVIGGPQPASLDAQLPRHFVYVWGWLLLVGGGMLVAANIIGDLLLAMLVERLGSVLLGGMCAVYSIAAFTYAGSIATFPASLAAAFGAAAFWRVAQITLLLRHYRTVLVQMQQRRDEQRRDRQQLRNQELLRQMRRRRQQLRIRRR